ncbi:hypothetical protein [Thiolapillus sp.]|uniref:hypothetical protein n=2 Tax=Thiolapillus sp. TaxID=2017437 RepID=UPI0025EA2589|nr:hypothetical protein [Thiolapillus sp.]
MKKSAEKTSIPWGQAEKARHEQPSMVTGERRTAADADKAITFTPTAFGEHLEYPRPADCDLVVVCVDQKARQAPSFREGKDSASPVGD